MATVTIDVPDDTMQTLGGTAETTGRALRLAAAFHLCGRGGLSASRAAGLAGMGYAEFLSAAADAGVALFDAAPADLEAELNRPLPGAAAAEAVRKDLNRVRAPGG